MPLLYHNVPQYGNILKPLNRETTASVTARQQDVASANDEDVASVRRKKGAGRHAFGLVRAYRKWRAVGRFDTSGERSAPFGLYSKDPGGSRRAGEYWYRYFMEPGRRWWVGINANLASTGVGLAKAARLLKEPRLAALAQRQLDWILGVNPFDASHPISLLICRSGFDRPARLARVQDEILRAAERLGERRERSAMIEWFE